MPGIIHAFGRRQILFGGIWIAILAVLLYSLRLLGPPDLMDNDQERPAAYILDVLHNGHWLCQRDHIGEICSKPPLYTWLAALCSLPWDNVSRLSVTLPTALATLAVSLLIYATGRYYFDWRSGFLAACVYLLSPGVIKQIALIRTDGLFTLGVTASALLAFRAWRLGRGWTWFWLTAAAATLTKGPLGLVLAGSGLIAYGWKDDTGRRFPLQGHYWRGLLLYLALTGGWFYLAYQQCGQPVFDKLIVHELWGHAVQPPSRDAFLGQQLFFPAFYFLTRFAPWSLITIYVFWRVRETPDASDITRHFERFLCCWFAAGLVIFTLSAHQRADLLLPLLPAAALLAGREIAQGIRFLRAPALLALLTFTVGCATGLTVWEYDFQRQRKAEVALTVEMRRFAEHLHQCWGKSFSLDFVDAPFALQFYLNTMQTDLSYAQAAQRLRHNPEARMVMRYPNELRRWLRNGDPSWRVLDTWPQQGMPYLYVVGHSLKSAMVDTSARVPANHAE